MDFPPIRPDLHTPLFLCLSWFQGLEEAASQRGNVGERHTVRSDLPETEVPPGCYSQPGHLWKGQPVTSWESLPCPKLHAQLLSLEIRNSQVSRAELTMSIMSVTERGMSSSSRLPEHRRRCGVRGADDKMLPGQVCSTPHAAHPKFG